ncbi:MAG: nuclear transport factor 2 family protein [Chloroflexi bacterium]|nr:nuclear transport factor 2 family protein [Chloroflexota bacterium]
MNDLSNDQVQSLSKTVTAFVQEIHTAIEHKNAQHIGELMLDDVFVLGAAANAVSIGKNQFVTDLRAYFEQAKDVEFQVQSSEIRVGLCNSGRSAWFFDSFIVENKEISRSIPIRFTGLLTYEHNWRLSAAYWSIPLRDNEYQYSLLQGGKIQSGVALDYQVAPEAQPLAQSLAKSMEQPLTMPELYSTRDDAFTIGSTVDEVFLAAGGKDFVQQITGLPLKFAIRGGVRGGISTDGCTAWMATHMDIVGGITMPYRFFYVWLREQGEWKIVVSHDAVSIDPFNSGFDFP